MSNLPEDRGRKPIVSTGRGGAGNLIRSPSRGIDPEVVPGAERGREITPREQSIDRVVHSGRGGAGNIRSPSRDPKAAIRDGEESALQDKLVSEARGRQAAAPFSTGRGGVGNIRDNSQSRSRSAVRDRVISNGGTKANGSPVPEHHAGGRGGYGNLTRDLDAHSVDQDTLDEQKKHEAQLFAHHQAEEAKRPQHTGKGGAGNIGHKYEHVDLSTLTLEEREAHEKIHAKDATHKYVSGGRGGAGNIHLSAGGGEERGRDAHKSGGLGSVFRSLSHAMGGRDKSSDPAKKEASPHA